MYFFALSQAPPVLAADIAICTPDTIAPGKKPANILGPNANPINNGLSTTYINIIYNLQVNQVISFKLMMLLLILQYMLYNQVKLFLEEFLDFILFVF